MPIKYISIQEASDLSGKSIQTLRRAIKAKKLKFQRKRTPQGFNYSLDKGSVCELYGLRVEEVSDNYTSTPKQTNQKVKKEIRKEKMMSIETGDFKAFARNMEALLTQYNEERQNFLGLVNKLQERIFILENQLNLIKAPAEDKSWYQFWK